MSNPSFFSTMRRKLVSRKKEKRLSFVICLFSVFADMDVDVSARCLRDSLVVRKYRIKHSKNRHPPHDPRSKETQTASAEARYN